MDFDPLVELGKDEGVRFMVRTFLELARDKFENIHSYLKDDDPINIENPDEVEEKALRQILSDPQNKKCEYILHFLRNIKKEEIDNDTAYSLLQSIDNMSWRQFCILSCLCKRESGQLEIGESISRTGTALQVETILNDVSKLMSDGYITDGSHNHFLHYARHSPDDLRLTPMAKEPIRLLQLDTIPDDDSDNPFLQWGITRTRRG